MTTLAKKYFIMYKLAIGKSEVARVVLMIQLAATTVDWRIEEDVLTFSDGSHLTLIIKSGKVLGMYLPHA